MGHHRLAAIVCMMRDGLSKLLQYWAFILNMVACAYHSIAARAFAFSIQSGGLLQLGACNAVTAELAPFVVANVIIAGLCQDAKRTRFN